VQKKYPDELRERAVKMIFGVVVTGRPAHDGRMDHGRDWSTLVGTMMSDRSPSSPATGPSRSVSSRVAAWASSALAAAVPD
jgi:hypothetical protein